jgi:hypothetical protein
MDNYTKISGCFASIILIVLMASFSSAAGAFFENRNGTWLAAEPLAEFGAISFNGSVETLSLAFTTKPTEGGIWVIPIPSKDASARSLSSFPEFQGVELREKAMESLFSTYESLFATQIYALPYLSLVGRYSLENRTVENASIQILDSVDAVGVGSELILPEKLDSYLALKKLNKSSGLEALQNYSEDYALIVSVVKPTNNSLTRGLIISFPTSKPYYPLSVPGSATDQPIVIYSIGNYLPELGDEAIDPRITYYYTPRNTSTVTGFFFSKDSNFYETSLNPPYTSKSELWFYQVPKKESAFLESIVKHPILWGLLVYIVLSCLASMIASAIVFRYERPKVFMFLLFGLANLLTLIGFWTIAYFKNVFEDYTEQENTLNQELVLTTGKRVALAVPIILLGLLILLIPISLLLELGSIFLPIFLSNIFVFYFIPALIFTILVLWGLFHEKKVLWFNLAFTGVFFALLWLSMFVFLLLI